MKQFLSKGLGITMLTAGLFASSTLSAGVFSPSLPTLEVVGDMTPEQMKIAQMNAAAMGKNGPSWTDNIYGGVGVGYGRIVAGDDAPVSSSLIEPLLALVFNTKTETGGMSYRGFLGLMMEISSMVSLGSELGFSWYPSSKARISQGLIGSIGTIRSTGYGVDMLFTTTFFFTPEIFFSFKPGLQLAHQKNKGKLSIDLSGLSGTSGSPKFLANNFEFSTKFSNTEFLPEVIFTSGWQFRRHHIGNWDLNKQPIVLEFFYQHVFGQDDASVAERVSSRDIFGGSLSVKF